MVSETEAQSYQGFSANQLQDCLRGNSTIYLQFKCEFDEDVTLRKQIGNFVSCMTVIICLVFRFTLYNMRSKVQLEEMIVDVQNVTTADFAIKLFLPKEVWDNWLLKK